MPSKVGVGSYTVLVQDVNERPTFLPEQPTQLSVVENSATGTLLAPFAAQDPDAADIGRLVFTWVNPVLAGNGQPVFEVDPASGRLSTLGPVNFEVRTNYSVRLRVTDLGGLFDEHTVRVDVVNVNEPPRVLPGQTFMAFENWGVMQSFGPVLASDPDAGTEFAFAIVSGNVGAAFAVDAATGMVSVSWEGALDFENLVVYNLTVRGPARAQPRPRSALALAPSPSSARAHIFSGVLLLARAARAGLGD